TWCVGLAPSLAEERLIIHKPVNRSCASVHQEKLEAIASSHLLGEDRRIEGRWRLSSSPPSRRLLLLCKRVTARRQSVFTGGRSRAKADIQRSSAGDVLILPRGQDVDRRVGNERLGEVEPGH